MITKTNSHVYMVNNQSTMEDEIDVDSNNDMAERVINHLSSIIKDPNAIDDFSIITSTTNSLDRNVSPVHYVESEHCLGLESWCVKQVFRYSQVQILKLRKMIIKRPTTEDVENLNKYINIALLIQAEVNTFWNIKRELFTYLSYEQEMRFTKLVLSYKPKSLQAYTYRVWLINKKQQCNYSEVLANEFLIIKKAVAASANNYHGWNHRIWCMEKLFPLIHDSNIIDELIYSQEFISQHVSEHSGFHYRQYAVRQFKHKMFVASEKLTQVLHNFRFVDYYHTIMPLDNEGHNNIDVKSFAMTNHYLNMLLYELFEVCKQLHVYYQGHEAIWYHRRFIFYEIISLLNNIYGINRHTMQSVSLVCNLGRENENMNMESDDRLLVMHESKLYKNLVRYEQNFISFLCTNNKNDESDTRNIEKHQRWLMHCLRIDLNANISLNNGEVLFQL